MIGRDTGLPPGAHVFCDVYRIHTCMSEIIECGQDREKPTIFHLSVGTFGLIFFRYLFFSLRAQCSMQCSVLRYVLMPFFIEK